MNFDNTNSLPGGVKKESFDVNAGLKYDVVVVGAGPAGCMAVINAPSWMRILMVESADLPRDVTCGGVLSAQSYELLSRYGIPESVFCKPKYLDRRLYEPGQKDSSGIQGDIYFNIEQIRLDRWLLDKAFSRDGIEAWPQSRFTSVQASKSGDRLRVHIEKSGRRRTVETRYIIGADGVDSSVRCSGGWKAPACCLTMQEKIISEGASIDSFLAFMSNDKDFYGWVIPKGDQLLIGAGYDGSSRNIAERFRSFREFLSGQHGIDGITSQPARIQTVTRMRSRRQITTGTSNLLLAGEAAGLTSAWTGEGISYALASGAMAGMSLGSDSPAPVYREYIKQLMPQVQKDMRLWRLIKRPIRRRIAMAFAPQTLLMRS